MKTNLLYIFPVLWILLFSCQREEIGFDVEDASTEKTFSFIVNIPDAKDLAQTRAWEEGEAEVLENMWVLIFDNAGSFLSRHEAIKVGTAQYTVTLPVTQSNIVGEGRKRILHFIANKDWTGFSDVENILVREESLIPTMSVDVISNGQTPKTAYWKRVVLSDGITSGTLLGEGINNVITLVRNTAKISVVNNTTGSIRYIKEVSWILGGQYKKGYIAGFDRNTAKFLDYEGEYPLGTVVNDVQSAARATPLVGDLDGNTAYIPTYTSYDGDGKPNGDILNPFAGGGVPQYAYEINNIALEEPSYIILRARYQNDYNDGVNPPYNNENEPLTYYKINIVSEGSTELTNIQRNKHYVIYLNDVSEPGYATFQEALDSDFAMNNIGTSIGQNYTSISDGSSILNVEYTNKTFVRQGEAFAVRYTYIPDAISTATDNSRVTVVLEQDAAKPVVAGNISYPNNKYPGSGVPSAYVDNITGITAAPPADENSVYQATIRVSHLDKDYLFRNINLRLRQPLKFTPVWITPQVANGFDRPVVLAFNIPESVGEYLFPMPIYITAMTLGPDPTQNSLSQDETSTGSYRHRYIAQGPGAQQVHFLTTSENNIETVKIEGDIFAPSYIGYSRSSTLQSFNPVPVFTPNGGVVGSSPLEPVKDVEVSLTFGIPAGTSLNGLVVKIFTSHLEYVRMGAGNESATMDTRPSGQSYYEYRPEATGLQTIVFKTITYESDELATVASDNFHNANVQRCTYKYRFNAVATATPGLIPSDNSKLALTFDIPTVAGGHPFNYVYDDTELCEVYIMGSGLSIDNSVVDQSAYLQVVTNELGISGFKYTRALAEGLPPSGKITLYFEASEYVRNQITLLSDRYDNVDVVPSLTANFTFGGGTLGSSSQFSPLPRNVQNGNTDLYFTLPEGSVPATGLTITMSVSNTTTLRSSTSSYFSVIEQPEGGNTTITTGTGNRTITVYKSGNYRLRFRTTNNNANSRRGTITLAAPGFNTTANLNQ